MTTGLTFGQRRLQLPQLDQSNLGQALMQQNRWAYNQMKHILWKQILSDHKSQKQFLPKEA